MRNEDVVQEVRVAYTTANEVVGKPQQIKLPFPCKVDINSWEIVALAHDPLVQVTDAAGAQHTQLLSILPCCQPH